jgi:hypothetical protein
MRLAFLALVACLASFAASAVVAEPAAERLVMKPYPGKLAWKRITDQSGDGSWFHEQIPADQDVNSFTDILSDQAFAKLKGYDPATFLSALFQRINGGCTGLVVNGPVAHVENGVTVVYGQAYCGQQNGQPYGVHMFYKLIGGADALYVIDREFHVPPSANGGQLSFPKDQAAAAMALLNNEAAANKYLTDDVYLCGGASGDPRCRPEAPKRA